MYKDDNDDDDDDLAIATAAADADDNGQESIVKKVKLWDFSFFGRGQKIFYLLFVDQQKGTKDIKKKFKWTKNRIKKKLNGFKERWGFLWFSLKHCMKVYWNFFMIMLRIYVCIIVGGKVFVCRREIRRKWSVFVCEELNTNSS